MQHEFLSLNWPIKNSSHEWYGLGVQVEKHSDIELVGHWGISRILPIYKALGRHRLRPKAPIVNHRKQTNDCHENEDSDNNPDGLETSAILPPKAIILKSALKAIWRGVMPF